ncbi:MAG: bifunctional methylenetetrahydrofolate dehydrogenase/methenyltetrahydrofolate cyclohydrolase FolD [Betaproteobacteria bacterium]|jgi:methylenetetrahydrofolate dehydrogenase (NADP+)/methenyltetrahydrofolate cyclohydrolase|nr:bifunctional methylenetetrahydrofolate dehydrogenase/methenyltetrahydrofolate cyclohydrolase FolD [Betaproteobacteria bacterium]
MSAIIIDGAAMARQVLGEMKIRVDEFSRNGQSPGLAVVLVGDDPASAVYVRSKERACREAGVQTFDTRMPATTTQAELLKKIDVLNADPRVHGILVQLPLPPHIDAPTVLQRIAVKKDVDGFSWRNLGALLDGHPTLAPCTPSGTMVMLERAGVPLSGRHAVVIGRSSIVGKPAALMLLARDATVTVCHSRTVDLAAVTRQADILVAAIGKPRAVTADMIKPGAAVIDVGINRLPDGKLCGDVDFEPVRAVAGWITPVPGGVGPMTVAMVISNVVQAAERSTP